MDLREMANAESKRLSTLWLGFAAAALAFGIHEIGGWGPTVAASLGAAAELAWGLSFFTGVMWAHHYQSIIKINGAMNSVAANHPRQEELSGKFRSVNIAARRAYERQLWLLVIGAMFFAVGQGVRVLDSRNTSNDRRCGALQNDMLSAQPKKENGPELFEALGCKPQGDGNIVLPAVPQPNLKRPPR